MLGWWGGAPLKVIDFLLVRGSNPLGHFVTSPLLQASTSLSQQNQPLPDGFLMAIEATARFAKP